MLKLFFISDIYVFNELSNLNKSILEDFGIIFKVICLISFRILNDLRDLNCKHDLDISILIFLRIKISIFESIFSFNGQL